MILFDLVVVTLLIFVNTFYVAAEFSAVSVQKGRVRKLAEEGSHFAQKLLPYVEDSRKLDQLIAASQVGITWSSLVLGAYGQAMLAVKTAPLLADAGIQNALPVASLGVLIILSSAQIVLGELVPKSLGMQYPTAVGSFTIYPMIWSMKIYKWIIAFLNGSAWMMLRLFRIPMMEGYRHIHSPEEIAHMIGESREAGLLEAREHKRLVRVLELSDRIVSDLMIPLSSVRSIPLSTVPEELLWVVTESPFTRIPVYRNAPDDLIGFVHTRDVVRAHAEGRLTSIEQVLHSGLQVRAQLSIERLLTFMREYRSHMAFVTDTTGSTFGTITLDDLLKEFFGRLPEETARKQK